MTFVPCSERELYWNFAVAESDSTRYAAHYIRQLSRRTLRAVLTDSRDGLTEQDWDELQKAVVGLRAPLITQLVQLGTRWFLGGLMLGVKTEVRMINYAPFVQLAPSRKLADFVHELDRGAEIPGDPSFANNYRTLRSVFDSARVRGRPVLVAEQEAGPFTEIEGLTRLSIMLSKRAHDAPPDTEVPILWGMCERLSEWNWR